MTDDIAKELRICAEMTERERDEEAMLEAADEIERLRERGDDWGAAMTENHDLWNENERLRAALEKIAQHDMQAIAMDALRPGERIRPAKEASDDAAT